MIYLPSNRSPKPHAQRFRILQPWETHYGPVSCRDYDCEQYLAGFAAVLPAGSDHALQLRTWLRAGFPDGLKRWATETVKDGGLVEFRFEAGQPCLKATQHRWHVRPPLFAHERNETRRNLKFDDFTDLMNNEAYKVNHELGKG